LAIVLIAAGILLLQTRRVECRLDFIGSTSGPVPPKLILLPWLGRDP
jgi:hypothetical protein